MSDNALHSDQTIVDGIHISHAFEYANAAARTGASVAIEDIGKVARQIDTGEFFILKDIVPTWIQMGGAGSAGGWQDDGVVVRLITVADDVVVGDTVMSGGGEKLRVVGDSRLEGERTHKTHATHPGSESRSVTFGVSHPIGIGNTSLFAILTLDDNSNYTFVVRIQARGPGGSAQLVHHARFMIYREAGGPSTLGPAGMQTDFIDKDNGAVTWSGVVLGTAANSIDIAFQTDTLTAAEVTGTVEWQKVSGP